MSDTAAEEPNYYNRLKFKDSTRTVTVEQKIRRAEVTIDQEELRRIVETHIRVKYGLKGFDHEVTVALCDIERTEDGAFITITEKGK